MKNSCGASAKYKRQIKALARIRRGQGTTHEGTFMDNAIVALRDDDTKEAVTNLKNCFSSVNLKVGEILELRDIVKSLSPRVRDRILFLSPFFRSILMSISHETIVFIIITATKAIYEKFLSIYWQSNGHKDYSRATSTNIKNVSFRFTRMECFRA